MWVLGGGAGKGGEFAASLIVRTHALHATKCVSNNPVRHTHTRQRGSLSLSSRASDTHCSTPFQQSFAVCSDARSTRRARARCGGNGRRESRTAEPLSLSLSLVEKFLRGRLAMCAPVYSGSHVDGVSVPMAFKFPHSSRVGGADGLKRADERYEIWNVGRMSPDENLTRPLAPAEAQAAARAQAGARVGAATLA